MSIKKSVFIIIFAFGLMFLFASGEWFRLLFYNFDRSDIYVDANKLENTILYENNELSIKFYYCFYYHEFDPHSKNKKLKYISSIGINNNSNFDDIIIENISLHFYNEGNEIPFNQKLVYYFSDDGIVYDDISKLLYKYKIVPGLKNLKKYSEFINNQNVLPKQQRIFSFINTNDMRNYKTINTKVNVVYIKNKNRCIIEKEIPLYLETSTERYCDD